MTFTLADIYLYPVKSLAGFKVTDWPVDKNGLKYDRKWMLIDDEGKFLSQRRLSKMALIHTRIDAEYLILSSIGYPDIAVPLAESTGDQIPVTIWKDQCLAHHCNHEVDAWLTKVLEHSCRLVYHPDQATRQVDQAYALISDQTAYSDGFPFLIVSDASLHALNTAMSLNLDMLRFRPNLVVTGCQSYAEDTWRKISINDIGFRLPKPCSRCPVPGIDPETGISSKEPLATLAKLRQWQHKVYFGQNALHDQIGELRVGSRVTIIETGAAQPPLA